MTGSKEIPLVARTGKLNAYSSETDSEHEKKSEGEPLIDPTVPIRKLSSKEKLKVYLTGVNWKNIAASVCLWLAVLTCCTAFSLMGLFFPQQVTIVVLIKPIITIMQQALCHIIIIIIISWVENSV